MLGDSITTDHISPAGAIDPDGPAARWLEQEGVAQADLNTFGVGIEPFNFRHSYNIISICEQPLFIVFNQTCRFDKIITAQRTEKF